MSTAASLHSLLNRRNWNLEDIYTLLDYDSSSINEIRDEETPLLRLIKHENCSLDVVRILLHYGACVDYRDMNGCSCLTAALLHSTDDEVIKTLVKAGAPVLNSNTRSLLCLAFEKNSSSDIIKLLFAAGSGVDTLCSHHGSILHCAATYPRAGLRKEVVELLLTVADVNLLNTFGQPPLCYALQFEADADDIGRLLKAGALLNICKTHISPLFCVTDSYASLKTDVVKLLLDSGAVCLKRSLKNDTPLHFALRKCKYETGAIRLLLDIPGTDVDDVNSAKETLLHCALDNPYMRKKAVELLIDRGAKVDQLDESKNTPLHSAAKNCACPASIIKKLLLRGCPLNAKNDSGRTPLSLAVEYRFDNEIIKMLLIAGAKVGSVRDGNMDSIIYAFINEQQDPSQQNNDCFRMLLKFTFIQNIEYDFDISTMDLLEYSVYSRLVAACLREIRIMESKMVGNDTTLLQFIKESENLTNLGVSDQVVKTYDFDQLIQVLIENKFPVFFDLIAARVGKSVLRNKLQDVQFFTFKYVSDLQGTKTKIALNYESLCEITKFLSVEDILQLIIALSVPEDHAGNNDMQI